MKVLLILAILVDLALAALLIGVSGFVFGAGPEGADGALWPALGWTTALVACLAAPIAGLLLMRRARPGLGLLVGWLPPIAGLVLALAPINPY